MEIPKSLRIWFIIHFIADIIFAIPLIIAPAWTLGLFGFESVGALTARLVGAALVGIGGASLFMHKEGADSFNTMLTLKILWSNAAIIAILLSIVEGGPKSQWLFLGIFVVFAVIWIYYKIKLRTGVPQPG